MLSGYLKLRPGSLLTASTIIYIDSKTILRLTPTITIMSYGEPPAKYPMTQTNLTDVMIDTL